VRLKKGGGDAIVFESAVQSLITTKEVDTAKKLDKDAR
jgi:hypothetical protein